MEVREIILEDDIQQARELFNSYKKFNGTPYQIKEDDFDIWYQGRQEGSKISIFGGFADGELIGTMRCAKWITVPIYNINGLFTKKGRFKTYSFSLDHPFPYIQDHILKKYEEEGYYTWYYHRQIRPGYYRLTKNQLDLLRLCKYGWDSEKNQYRYERTVEEIVEANTITEVPNYRIQLGTTPWKNNTMIVMCSLKQEYRATPDIF